MQFLGLCWVKVPNIKQPIALKLKCVLGYNANIFKEGWLPLVQIGENFVIISDLAMAIQSDIPPWHVLCLAHVCSRLQGNYSFFELRVDLERAILYVHRIRTEYWQSKDRVSAADQPCRNRAHLTSHVEENINYRTPCTTDTFCAKLIRATSVRMLPKCRPMIVYTKRKIARFIWASLVNLPSDRRTLH